MTMFICYLGKLGRVSGVLQVGIWVITLGNLAIAQSLFLW